MVCEDLARAEFGKASRGRDMYLRTWTFWPGYLFSRPHTRRHVGKMWGSGGIYTREG